MVRENKVGLSAEHVTLQEQTLSDEQEQADGLTVTGLALPFGEESRNGVVYEEESVREAAETMIGAPVLFNHDQDEVVGHVEDVEIHGDGMSYRMNLNPEHELIKSVERGDISNVSIQALVDPVDGDTKKVEVKEFLELSLVTIPGFKQTDVEVEEVGEVPNGVMTVESFVAEAYDFEVGDFVEWEFGEGTSQGEIVDRTDKEGDSLSAGGNEFTVDDSSNALYKMQEWGEESAEFTNNVVKFEDALSRSERPEEAPGTAPRNEDVSKEPFAGYDDFEDCVNQNQDKADPEAYCGEIKDRAESFVEEQFDSYPEEAVQNAQTALDAEENTEFDNGECGTQVGWERANQLVNGENLSEDTVRRMHSFFERSEGNEEVEEPPKEEDCGWLMHMAWGGDAAKEWAADMVEEFDGDGEESFGTDESASKPVENENIGDTLMDKIEEQLSADEVDSVMELINLHNEAMKEDIRQYMEENDLIEDEEEPEEPEEEPEDDMEDDEEGTYSDKDKDMDDEEESSESESVDEEESEESSEDSETESEESVEEDESGGDQEDEQSKSVDDEPVDPVAEEMDTASEDADFTASIPRISR